MTDRLNALLVILEQDIREDDAEGIINAIAHIKGVLKVKPHVKDFSEAIAEERARNELGQKLWGVIYPREGERK